MNPLGKSMKISEIAFLSAGRSVNVCFGVGSMRLRSIELSNRSTKAAPEYWPDKRMPFELTISNRTHWISIGAFDWFSRTI